MAMMLEVVVVVVVVVAVVIVRPVRLIRERGAD